jgi:hypothetical protein
MRSAIASVSARLSQKNRLFLPAASPAAWLASKNGSGSRTTAIARGLGSLGGSITTPARREVPPSHDTIACGLPTVADSPTRSTSWRLCSAMRSRTLIRWAPRSVPARAWTSSTTTIRRSANSRAVDTLRDASMTSRDSGVVMSSSAGSATKALRAAALTSPCHRNRRRPTISA